MVATQLDPFQNRILAELPKADLDRLRPHVEAVELTTKQVVYDVGETINFIYFIEAGMASLVIALEEGSMVEVGVVGREGLAGLPALLGNQPTRHLSLVQLPGSAIRVKAEICRQHMALSPTFGERVLRFAQALQDQVAQTAVCNARHEVQERLARWLLMAHDRAGYDELPLTHEFVATMLGVRRAGVTVAAGLLKMTGAITYTRAKIHINSRQRLEEAACECYRVGLGPKATARPPQRSVRS